MSAPALRDLRKAILNQAFEPAYFLHGDDEYRKETSLRELVQGAVDAATRDFNFDQLRGGDTTAEQLESALHTPPMMAARRVVVVREVMALRKDARDLLSRYLARPSRDTVVVLAAAPGGSASGKGEKDFESMLKRHAVSLSFSLMDEREAAEWVVQQAHAVHGTTLTERGLSLLLEAVGTESARLATELDKLASYTRGAAIDEAAVADVVGVREGATLSDFLDRVAARDVAGALALVEHVLLLPRSGLVPVVIALTVQTMAMGWGRLARDRGLPAQRLESEFFALLKETGAFPMRPWSEATRCWARHLPRWDAASVERALAALLAADRAAKETRLSSDAQVLSSLVCALCASARRTAA